MCSHPAEVANLSKMQNCDRRKGRFRNRTEFDDGEGVDDADDDEDDIGNQLVERPPSFLFSLFFNLHRD